MSKSSIRSLPGRNGVIALILSFLSLLFILLVLLSGTGGHISASYLTIDTTELSVPSKLSTSTLLHDLSQVSKSDLVGGSNTQKTLGLAQTYDIALLTACGRGGTTACTSSQVGYTFDPTSALKLSRTAAQGTFSSSYNKELNAYASVSNYVGIAYTLSIPLLILSSLCIFLAPNSKPLLLSTRILSALTAILVLSATIASIVTFARLRNVFNHELGAIGVKTSLDSSAIGLSVAATITSLATFILTLFLRMAETGNRGQYSEVKEEGEKHRGTPSAEEIRNDMRAKLIIDTSYTPHAW
ncbi:SUR7/PalI family-domain-containing protein [Xylariaceae sp. FL1272]|nr:SUR7/PalI family-domain-containing protein [Xylariaceae sp. FL1272]